MVAIRCSGGSRGFLLVLKNTTQNVSEHIIFLLLFLALETGSDIASE